MTESWYPLPFLTLDTLGPTKMLLLTKNVKTTAVGRSLNFEPDWRI